MATPSPKHQPLAEFLRPKTLGEVIAQKHLLGECMALPLAFESGRPLSARDGLEQRRTIGFVDEAQRFNKAVKSYINQQLRKAFVQFLVLPHCSMGVKHG